MRLIRNEDLRSLFTGAAMVAVAGLAAGGLMYPDLRGPADAEGPQLQAGVSGARTQHYGEMTASWAAYDGRVPDYVIGTQWLQPPQHPEYVEAEAEEIPPQEETVVYTAATGDTTEAVEAGWQEPPREPVTYPSTNGGVPYGADLPKPPPPPEDDPEVADLHAANPG